MAKSANAGRLLSVASSDRRVEIKRGRRGATVGIGRARRREIARGERWHLDRGSGHSGMPTMVEG